MESPKVSTNDIGLFCYQSETQWKRVAATKTPEFKKKCRERELAFNPFLAPLDRADCVCVACIDHGMDAYHVVLPFS